MTDYLTPDELVDLTDAKSRKGQERWLRENGFRFLRSTTGALKVLRAHRDARMGRGAANDAHAAEPDFSIFRKSA